MNENSRRIALAVVLAGAAPVTAQDALPFSDGRWELTPKGVRAETVDGRETLAFETGGATRRDVKLQDGTIEMEVQVTRRRSFVYLTFRMQDDREYEDFYLRPHKSGLPDSLQYAPVYQGQSAWQLYHGPGATAAVEFQPGVWTRLRLVVQGTRAAIFLGPGDRPAMVARLARESRPGFIGLRAFLPPDTPGSGPVARFANVTVRPNVVPFDFSTTVVEAPAIPPGVIRRWDVSGAVPPSDTPPAVLPAADALGAFRNRDAGAVHVLRPAARAGDWGGDHRRFPMSDLPHWQLHVLQRADDSARAVAARRRDGARGPPAALRRARTANSLRPTVWLAPLACAGGHRGHRVRERRHVLGGARRPTAVEHRYRGSRPRASATLERLRSLRGDDHHAAGDRRRGQRRRHDLDGVRVSLEARRPRAPAFVAPHQPRLDWQMWFAALSDSATTGRRGVQALARRLLEGSPPVRALLAPGPWSAHPPRFSAALYDYRFTDCRRAARKVPGGRAVQDVA